MKKIIYFDLDGVLANFAEKKSLGHDADEDVPGFFLDLKPYEDGVKLFHKLAKHHEVLIASTAPWDNPNSWSEKRRWVEKYLQEDAKKKLVLTHRKDLLIGDYLIDDRTKNGAGNFKGKLILFGSEEFPDWKTVEVFFQIAGLL